MNTEFILRSSILDLRFENRNKIYGAYNLRKFYNDRFLKSLAITLSAAAIVCVFITLPKKAVRVTTYAEIEMAHVKEVKIREIKKQPIKPQTVAAKAVQRKFVSQIIIVENIAADTLQFIKPSDIIASSTINLKGEVASGLIGMPVEILTSAATGAAISVKKTVDLNAIISNPDIQPSYPGGIAALKKFLERNLVNPTQMEGDEMVAVNIGFVVGYDGKLQQFAIIKDGGVLYNQEVLRVVKKMPQWIPGKANGKNVAVNFTIPVKFVSAD